MPLTQLIVRTAEPRDLPLVIALQAASPAAARWTPVQYAHSQQQGWLFVASQDDTVVGFLAAQSAAGESELLNMAVSDGARRQGIGAALIRHFLIAVTAAGAHRVLLEVRASNAAAIALYRKFGFQQDGTRKAYYSNPTEDALLFSLSLQKSS